MLIRSPYRSPAGTGTPSLKPNVNRNKTRRWVNARQVSYDGDDWGNSDEDEEEEETPPQVPTAPVPSSRGGLGTKQPWLNVAPRTSSPGSTSQSRPGATIMRPADIYRRMEGEKHKQAEMEEEEHRRAQADEHQQQQAEVTHQQTDDETRGQTDMEKAQQTIPAHSGCPPAAEPSIVTPGPSIGPAPAPLQSENLPAADSLPSLPPLPSMSGLSLDLSSASSPLELKHHPSFGPKSAVNQAFDHSADSPVTVSRSDSDISSPIVPTMMTELQPAIAEEPDENNHHVEMPPQLFEPGHHRRSTTPSVTDATPERHLAPQEIIRPLSVQESPVSAPQGRPEPEPEPEPQPEEPPETDNTLRRASELFFGSGPWTGPVQETSKNPVETPAIEEPSTPVPPEKPPKTIGSDVNLSATINFVQDIPDHALYQGHLEDEIMSSLSGTNEHAEHVSSGPELDKKYSWDQWSEESSPKRPSPAADSNSASEKGDKDEPESDQKKSIPEATGQETAEAVSRQGTPPSTQANQSTIEPSVSPMSAEHNYEVNIAADGGNEPAAASTALTTVTTTPDAETKPVQPVSNAVISLPPPPPEASFSQIVNLPTSEARISAFNAARQQVAHGNTGLAAWLSVVTDDAHAQEKTDPALAAVADGNGLLPAGTDLSQRIPSSARAFPAKLSHITGLAHHGSVSSGHSHALSSHGSRRVSGAPAAVGNNLLHLSGRAGGAARELLAKGRSRLRNSE